MPRVTNMLATAEPLATDVGSVASKPPSYIASSLLSTGDATSAPPPKPMIAKPGGETRTVREPLDQRGHRRDVADAEADAADDAVAEVEQPELAGGDAGGADQEADRPVKRGCRPSRGAVRRCRPRCRTPRPRGRASRSRSRTRCRSRSGWRRSCRPGASCRRSWRRPARCRGGSRGPPAGPASGCNPRERWCVSGREWLGTLSASGVFAQVRDVPGVTSCPLSVG